MAGASSGVAVADDCVSAFMDLKKKRTFRYIVYKISDDKSVVLEKTGSPDVRPSLRPDVIYLIYRVFPTCPGHV